MKAARRSAIIGFQRFPPDDKRAKGALSRLRE